MPNGPAPAPRAHHSATFVKVCSPAVACPMHHCGALFFFKRAIYTYIALVPRIIRTSSDACLTLFCAGSLSAPCCCTGVTGARARYSATYSAWTWTRTPGERSRPRARRPSRDTTTQRRWRVGSSSCWAVETWRARWRRCTCWTWESTPPHTHTHVCMMAGERAGYGAPNIYIICIIYILYIIGQCAGHGEPDVGAAEGHHTREPAAMLHPRRRGARLPPVEVLACPR